MKGISHKLTSMLLCIGFLLAVIPNVSGPAHAACSHDVTGMPVYCSASHEDAYGGHRQFQYCRLCGAKMYTGGVVKKTNCSKCNPAITCDHPADSRWVDPNHASGHPIVCRKCCTQLAKTSYVGSCPSCQASGQPSSSSGTGQDDPSGDININVINNVSGETVKNGGIISIEYAEPQTGKISVVVDCPGSDAPENITYTDTYGKTIYIKNGFVINIAAGTNNDVGTYYFYAKSYRGLVRQIAVTIKVQSAAIANIKYRTIGMYVRNIQNVKSFQTNPFFVSLVGASTIDPRWKDTIPNAIQRFDGQTYYVTGGLGVEIYDGKTGQVYGSYDLWDSIQKDKLLKRWAWGGSTVSSFATMTNVTLSYQAPIAVSSTANVVCDGAIVETKNAQSVGAPKYIFPYEQTAFTFTTSDRVGYDYNGLTWSRGGSSGSDAGKSYTYSPYTYNSLPATVNFNYSRAAGTVNVVVYDSVTLKTIPTAKVVLTNGSKKAVTPGGNLPYGAYTATASAEGYTSGFGSATISKANKSATITIYLDPLDKKSNQLEVFVLNDKTSIAIPGATVTLNGAAKSTNSSGSCSFSGLSLGSCSVTASKSGFYPRTVSKTIIAGSNSMVIRLSEQPGYNMIRVTVREKDSEALISGAEVSVAGQTTATNATGMVSIAGMDAGTYTVRVSGDGYLTNDTMTATVNGSTANVTVYLTRVTDTVGDGKITAFVRDADDNVLDGATVILRTASGQTIKTDTTSAGGFAVFYHLAVGSYTVFASKPGYIAEQTVATITADALNATVTLYLDLDKKPGTATGAIRVTVYDEYTRQPIDGAKAHIETIDSTVIWYRNAISQSYADYQYYSVTLPPQIRTQYPGTGGYIYGYYYWIPDPTGERLLAEAQQNATNSLNAYNSYTSQLASYQAGLEKFDGYTNSNGVRLFRSVSAGYFEMNISANGYNSVPASTTVAGTNTAEVVVYLSRAASQLQVKVYDRLSGAVIPGATITCNDYDRFIAGYNQNTANAKAILRQDYSNYNYNNYLSDDDIAIIVGGSATGGLNYPYSMMAIPQFAAKTIWDNYNARIAYANSYKTSADIFKQSLVAGSDGGTFYGGLIGETYTFYAEAEHYRKGSAAIGFNGSRGTANIYLDPTDSRITVKVVDSASGSNIPNAEVTLNCSVDYQGNGDSYTGTAAYYGNLATSEQARADALYNQALADIKPQVDQGIQTSINYGTITMDWYNCWQSPEYMIFMKVSYGMEPAIAQLAVETYGKWVQNEIDRIRMIYLPSNGNYQQYLTVNALAAQYRSYQNSYSSSATNFLYNAKALNAAGVGKSKYLPLPSLQLTYKEIPFSTYTAIANAEGYVTGTATVTTSDANPRPIVTIYLTRSGSSGTVNVTVQNQAGTKLPGAQVALNSGQTGTTGTGGSVTYNNVNFASIYASAFLEGYEVGTATGVLNSAHPVLNLTITLKTAASPKGDLAVYVRDKGTGDLIPGATVVVRNSVGSTVTDLMDLPYDTYTASASAAGYKSGTGSATLNAAQPSGAITIYLEADLKMEITPITNGVYRKGSTVMTSAVFTATADVTPTSPATVTMTATYRRISDSGYVSATISTQSKSVIVPSGETNLVWFSLTLPPDGYYDDNAVFTFTVIPSGGGLANGQTNSVRVPVTERITRSAPEKKFEKSAPPTFQRLNTKKRSCPSLSWTVWEWASGGFSRNTFTAALSSTAALSPDSTAGYATYDSVKGLWITRSGYGLNTSLQVSVQNFGGMIAGTAKADVFYPEYNYTAAANQSGNLLCGSFGPSGSHHQTILAFPPDVKSISGHPMHKTPVWYPNGEYTVVYRIFDVWTPAGELTADDYATLLIDGNMYDDSYVQPLD